MKLIITGGIPKKDHYKQEEGFKFEKAFIQELDWNSGKITKELLYVSPPEHCGENATQQAKTGTIWGDKLIVPTNTEILFVDLQTLDIEKTISLSSFNDLHHVNVSDNKIYLANTGLEMVQILSFDGELLEEVPQASTPTWERFDKKTDYRFYGSTKPHEVHLNHVFFIDRQPWCTRFQFRDAINIYAPSKRIDLHVSNGMPHDGLVIGDYIYFTITDGFLVVANKNTCQREAVYDLNKLSGEDKQLGWCRGVHIDGNHAYVGFSRLRKSKFKEYATWVVHGEKQLPSRVSLFNLDTRSLERECSVGKDNGAAVFSVLATE